MPPRSQAWKLLGPTFDYMIRVEYLENDEILLPETILKTAKQLLAGLMFVHEASYAQRGRLCTRALKPSIYLTYEIRIEAYKTRLTRRIQCGFHHGFCFVRDIPKAPFENIGASRNEKPGPNQRQAFEYQVAQTPWGGGGLDGTRGYGAMKIFVQYSNPRSNLSPRRSHSHLVRLPPEAIFTSFG